LEFRFREKYNAANAPAQTMLSTPSTTYFVSIPVMISVVISTMFHTMLVHYDTNLLNVDLLSQKFITVLGEKSLTNTNYNVELFCWKDYFQYDSIEQAAGLELTKKIPDWIKNIFLWYDQDLVSISNKICHTKQDYCSDTQNCTKQKQDNCC